MVKDGIKDLIATRRARVGVIGLGYVGLPLAVEFGRKVLYTTERPSFTELEEHVRQPRAK